MLVQRWHTTIGITLCQRWPNVSVPMLGRCWHNVGVQPLGQRWANWQIHVGTTLVSRRWPNVRVDVGPTLGQRRNASWDMITQLVWTTWTPISVVPQKAIKHNHPLTDSLVMLKGWQRSWSTLPQVMACCLMAPSHYLNHWWLFIDKVEWPSSDGNFTASTKTTVL